MNQFPRINWFLGLGSKSPKSICCADKFTEEHLSRLSNRIDTMNSTMTEIKVYLMAKMGDNTIGRGKR